MPTQRKGRKPTLAIIANSVYAFGGGEKWSLELAKSISGSFTVKIASAFPRGERVSKTIGDLRREYGAVADQIVDIECSGKRTTFGADRYTMMIPRPSAVKRLYDLISDSDLVYHVSFNPLIISYSMLFSTLLGKKLIVGVHNPTFSNILGGKSTTAKKLYVALLGKARYFHTLNQNDDALVKRNFPKAKSFQVPIFVTRAYNVPRLNRKKFIALFVGRLEKSQKGVDLLCSSMERALRTNPEVVFHVVGASGDGDALVAKVSKKYPNNVARLGFVSDMALDKEYSNSSLYLLPSRYEGLPASLLEAQLHGLPAVAFDVKGPSDMLIEDVQGVLVRPFDTEKFADAVSRYFQMWDGDKSGYSAMGKKIKSLVEQRYSKANVIPMMISMFEEVLHEK